MDMCRKRSAWAIAGMLLTLTVATPVWADDVELLLSTPAASDAAKPNILFIIDSSGSMMNRMLGFAASLAAGFDPFPVRTLWTQDGIE